MSDALVFSIGALAHTIGTWDGWKKPFQFDVWGVLFWMNLAIVVGLVVVLWISLRRDRREKTAANMVPFLGDDDLEGPRLERVLGWALFFLAILALAYPLYWLRETAREKSSVKYFDELAVERGKVLFSNTAMEESYNAAKSLQCANCHGVAGAGGSGAPYTYTDPTTGVAYGGLTWRAPALNTVLYKFSPKEVKDIITFGRAGTPMQAWGIEGGGPKNEQSIEDLVAYIQSIQLTPGTTAEVEADIKGCTDPKSPKPAKTATGQTSCALEEARTQAVDQQKTATEALASAIATRDANLKEYDEKKCGTDDATDKSRCAELFLLTQSYPDRATPIDDNTLKAAQQQYDALLKQPKSAERDAAVAAAKFNLDAAGKKFKADKKAFAAKKCGTDQESVADEAACTNLERALREVTIQAADAKAVDTARANLEWANEWEQRRQGVTDGQLLFETNCARCHTQNWSIFDPTNADLKPESLVGPPGGNGVLGFNLRAGGAARRFPNTRATDGTEMPHSGILSQIQFVANGSEDNVAYGKGGIGSGRMPGQCNEGLRADTAFSLRFYGCMMTQSSDTDASTYRGEDNPSTPIDEAMIDQIVLFERCGIDQTSADLRPPPNYVRNCD